MNLLSIESSIKIIDIKCFVSNTKKLFSAERNPQKAVLSQNSGKIKTSMTSQLIISCYWNKHCETGLCYEIYFYKTEFITI